MATLGYVDLTSAVARNLHKLMAYKDEYEVARLMTHSDGLALAESVGADLAWHLHPPTLDALGRKEKIRFAAKSQSTFDQLAKGKRVRGTKLDPFGRTAMRRMERELVDEFEQTIDMLRRGIEKDSSSGRIAAAIAIANLPEMVRGFEDLKVRRVAQYRRELRALVKDLGTEEVLPTY